MQQSLINQTRPPITTQTRPPITTQTRPSTTYKLEKPRIDEKPKPINSQDIKKYHDNLISYFKNNDNVKKTFEQFGGKNYYSIDDLQNNLKKNNPNGFKISQERMKKDIDILKNEAKIRKENFIKNKEFVKNQYKEDWNLVKGDYVINQIFLKLLRKDKKKALQFRKKVIERYQQKFSKNNFNVPENDTELDNNVYEENDEELLE